MRSPNANPSIRELDPLTRKSRRLISLFRRVRTAVGRRSPSMKQIRMDLGCPEARRDHDANPRYYCHAFHRRGKICCAGAMVFLPKTYQVGILLHEFGHLGGGRDELAADRWVMKRLGVPLLYRGPQSLEWASPEYIRKLGV